MRRATVIVLSLSLVSGCQTLPIDDPRLVFDSPQYGLVSGPNGWYLTRQDGAWGTSAHKQVWILRTGMDAMGQPGWADPSFSDSDFYYSASQQRGCFDTSRPLPDSSVRDDPNIWCASWNGVSWSPPTPLPEIINSSAREWSPVLAADGSLYFASDRSGGLGMGDLYKASFKAGAWRVTPLPETVNSKYGEWNLDVSPDGQVLVFESSHREENRTVAGDLYLSQMIEGEWTAPIALADLNTDGSDLLPRFISRREIIFTTVENGESKFRTARLDVP